LRIYPHVAKWEPSAVSANKTRSNIKPSLFCLSPLRSLE
jgi:hypothetical protein